MPIKLSSRQYIILTEGERRQSTYSRESNEWIYTEYQHFMLGCKHLKGSEGPVGHFDSGYSSSGLAIRWLYTESNGHFAPEFEYQPRTQEIVKLATKVGNALVSLRYDGTSPEKLIEALKATVVEYVPDSYATYKPLRVHGEPAMMTLARSAR